MWLLILFTFLSVFFISVHLTYAQSSYVLPYPGFMPGNKLYKLTEALDMLKKYYSFGDFAKYKYYQSLADKKLVEAKILFEYSQYPLALKALDKSDEYFQKIPEVLKEAKKHDKNITEKEALFRQESLKHIEALTLLESQVPVEFTWRDEKKTPVHLQIKNLIEKALKIRKTFK